MAGHLDESLKGLSPGEVMGTAALTEELRIDLGAAGPVERARGSARTYPGPMIVYWNDKAGLRRDLGTGWLGPSSVVRCARRPIHAWLNPRSGV